ncbi:MAG: ATP-binding protein [Alphaproteobacteria bacterium]|nr:ATP-binding protein [Alphaproteobacteria bacterium]
MYRHKFVHTSNVKRFLLGSASLNERGAPEASILLLEGNAGLGKSRTAEWWAMQNDAIFLRIKAKYTPHWLLTDLLTELGEQASAHSCEKLYNQAVGILAKEPRPIVLDEVEAGLKNIEVLETVRDLSDLVELPVIFVGREYVWGKLAKHPQFRTRIGARVSFSACAIEDVRLCFDELCEVKVDDGIIETTHKQSDGHIREIINAVANAERIAKRKRLDLLTAADVEGVHLVREFQRAKGGVKAA